MSVIVFLGPSLPAAEAKAIVDCDIRPPARQGDLFRVLSARPELIVLIDGVFEHSPSVWHHEIVAANACGIPMIGASSMGALRAAEFYELYDFTDERGFVTGVGEIFKAYVAHRLVDDGEVALLHASAEHGFRPLTVPLVNVREAAEVALQKKVLNRAQAVELVEAAKAIFYQARSWPKLLEAVGWSAKTRAKWDAFAKAGLPDVKARDAREALMLAAEWMKEGPPQLPVRPKTFPSHVRKRRVHEDVCLGVPSGLVAELAAEDPESKTWVGEGVRRNLVAYWAREMGVKISEEELADGEQLWLALFEGKSREEVLAESGLDESQFQTFIETLSLDVKALKSSLWMVSDAPPVDEAIAMESRRRGIWQQAARTLAKQKRSAH